MAKAKNYIVSVEDKKYCGIGAGGAQFAYGEARITSERLANWFREHEGYTVKEVKDAKDADGKEAEGKDAESK